MAQPKVMPVKSDSAKTTVTPYNSIITAKTISKKGLFGIHQTGDKYFFEIPDSIMGRELLLTTWLVKVPGGSGRWWNSSGHRILRESTSKGEAAAFRDKTVH